MNIALILLGLFQLATNKIKVKRYYFELNMATVNKSVSMECNIVRRRVECTAAGLPTMTHTAGSDGFDQRLPFAH